MKHPARDDDHLLTRDQVEDMFGISRRYLEAAAHRGEGPAIVRIGRSVRYRIRDVRAWIEACAGPARSGGRA